MRRVRPDTRWIYGTSAPTFCIAVSTLLATVVMAAHNVHDELLDASVPVPEFLPGPVNVTVREGDVALLPCTVRNLGTKQVAWRRIRIEGDNFLTIGTMTWASDSNVSVNHSRKSIHVTSWDLVIQRVKQEDDGMYECQVTSRAGHVRLVQLNVVESAITKPDSHHPPGLGPPENNAPNVPVSVCGAADKNGCLISLTGKRYVDLGDKIYLVCNASGGPRIPDEIDWFKSGDKIDTSKHRHVVLEKHQSMADRSFISTLTIEHSSLTDTDDYICRSSRDDIVSLKVTVLNAESANKRRGTRPGPTMGRNQAEDSNGQRHASCQMSALTLTVLVALIARCSSSFGLYS